MTFDVNEIEQYLKNKLESELSVIEWYIKDEDDEYGCSREHLFVKISVLNPFTYDQITKNLLINIQAFETWLNNKQSEIIWL